MDKERLLDEELCQYARQGDSECIDILMIRYKPLVRQIAKSYFMNGSEHSDMLQEGMIGLFKASRSYSNNKNTSFKSFANLCIRRQIFDAIKATNRNKHIPLNKSLSLDDNEIAADYLINDELCPNSVLEESESHQKLREDINRVLSQYEIKILNHYLDGKNYQDISVSVGKDSKSIDNAMQRIKKKIKNLL